MKIQRSTRCTLKFSNAAKLSKLDAVLKEYGRVVNRFIDLFWLNCPHKNDLLKPIVDSVETWFSARLRKVAAREAIDLIQSSKQRNRDAAVKPHHKSDRMHVSSTIASLKPSKTKEFDCWLHLYSIGNKTIIDFPIKLHKHFYQLAQRGKRLESYIITKEYIQFCFEIETGPKKEKDACIGIDTGINALASTSTGEQFGTDVKQYIERINRRQHGSKGQQRAVRQLRQYMNEIAKRICAEASLVVVENLKGITLNTKRRLVKNTRRSIGRWNVRYWLSRLQMTCEDMNVSFRTVSPWKTSQRCSVCGHTDRRNRNAERFVCRECGHSDNSDLNAATNILNRFLTGKYGSGCKPLNRPIVPTQMVQPSVSEQNGRF